MKITEFQKHLRKFGDYWTQKLVADCLVHISPLCFLAIVTLRARLGMMSRKLTMFPGFTFTSLKLISSPSKCDRPGLDERGPPPGPQVPAHGASKEDPVTLVDHTSDLQRHSNTYQIEVTFQTEPWNGHGEQERLSGSGRPTWISERQVNTRNQGGQMPA
ncbi:uncharacterized protein LOC123381925 isoform X2 [Felis catus]|uniref:uncharacterized protein LOC123381925 isoform X2 n=1 Tax=Felis catus TaxID=9685 RepID=UPI001D1A1449|nr:uncharacterized protein LOC123381925 isoform X2 [Felis catus]